MSAPTLPEDHTALIMHLILGCLQLTPSQYEALKRHEKVQDVHTDGAVHTHQAIDQLQTQQNAAWDVDRMDQPNLPLDGTYRYTSDGTGVNAYVIDTVRFLFHVTITIQILAALHPAPPPLLCVMPALQATLLQSVHRINFPTCCAHVPSLYLPQNAQICSNVYSHLPSPLPNSHEAMSVGHPQRSRGVPILSC